MKMTKYFISMNFNNIKFLILLSFNIINICYYYNEKKNYKLEQNI